MLNPRRYVLTILGLLALMLAATIPVSWAGLGQCPLADRSVCGIYHFQQAKLAAAPARIDLLMLGDSSLGNGVDTPRMSALSGRATLNLALTGSALGLPAIYSQLRATLAEHRVENLVIMLSPEDFRHRFARSAEGYVFVNSGDPRRFATSPGVFLRSVGAMATMLFDIGTLDAGFRRLAMNVETPGDCVGCNELGYQRQTRIGFIDNGDVKEWKGPLDDYDPFLARIAAMCRAENVNCLYMHGPIVQAVLDVNPGYVAAIDAKIAAFGLHLVDPQPIIIAEDQVGDAINHVRPEFRAAYTEKIYRQLAPLLK